MLEAYYKDIPNVAQKLQINGCESVMDFIPRELCEIIKKQALDIFNSVDLLTTKEYETFIVGNNSLTRELPGDLVAYPKPTLVTRGMHGDDVGFVDMFNADRLIDEIPIKKIHDYAQSLFQSLGYSNITVQYSIYWNSSGSVENIRGYHRDSPVMEETQKRLFKLFVYLTDVRDVSFGPYSYIPGTHLKSMSQKFANQLMGNYDSPSGYDFSLSPRIFLGDSGTMIVSNQAGFHRGFQQKKGKERVMLVCKIRPR